jgi:hypothetical protein
MAEMKAEGSDVGVKNHQYSKQNSVKKYIMHDVITTDTGF